MLWVLNHVFRLPNVKFWVCSRKPNSVRMFCGGRVLRLVRGKRGVWRVSSISWAMVSCHCWLLMLCWSRVGWMRGRFCRPGWAKG